MGLFLPCKHLFEAPESSCFALWLPDRKRNGSERFSYGRLGAGGLETQQSNIPLRVPLMTNKNRGTESEHLTQRGEWTWFSPKTVKETGPSLPFNSFHLEQAVTTSQRSLSKQTPQRKDHKAHWTGTAQQRGKLGMKHALPCFARPPRPLDPTWNQCL